MIVMVTFVKYLDFKGIFVVNLFLVEGAVFGFK